MSRFGRLPKLAALAMACGFFLPAYSCSVGASKDTGDPRASAYFEVPEWRPGTITRLGIVLYNSSAQTDPASEIFMDKLPDEKVAQIIRNFVIADNTHSYRPYGVGPDRWFGPLNFAGYRRYLKTEAGFRYFFVDPVYYSRSETRDFGSNGFMVVTADQGSFDEVASLVPNILIQGDLIEEDFGPQCRYYRYSQGNDADDLSGIVMLDEDGDARLDLAVEATRTCIGQLFAKSMGLQLTAEQLMSLMGFRPDHSMSDGSCEFIATTTLPSDQRPLPLRYDGCPTAPDLGSYALPYFLLGREDRETAGDDRIELMREICREQVLDHLDPAEYCQF